MMEIAWSMNSNDFLNLVLHLARKWVDRGFPWRMADFNALFFKRLSESSESTRQRYLCNFASISCNFQNFTRLISKVDAVFGGGRKGFRPGKAAERAETVAEIFLLLQCKDESKRCKNLPQTNPLNPPSR
jgi:hypothetical protein